MSKLLRRLLPFQMAKTKEAGVPPTRNLPEIHFHRLSFLALFPGLLACNMLHVRDNLGDRKPIDYALRLHAINVPTFQLNWRDRSPVCLSIHLPTVFDAIIFARLPYATTAWRGYSSLAESCAVRSRFSTKPIAGTLIRTVTTLKECLTTASLWRHSNHRRTGNIA